MGAMLDKAVDSTIEKAIPPSAQEVKTEERDMVFELAKNNLREKIKKEIVQELTDEEKNKIKADAENAYMQDRLKHIMILFVEGVAVAGIVGLIVNQATDIISYLKCDYSLKYGATVLILLLLVLILFIIIALQLSSAISEFFQADKKRG